MFFYSLPSLTSSTTVVKKTFFFFKETGEGCSLCKVRNGEALLVIMGKLFESRSGYFKIRNKQSQAVIIGQNSTLPQAMKTNATASFGNVVMNVLSA